MNKVTINMTVAALKNLERTLAYGYELSAQAYRLMESMPYPEYCEVMRQLGRDPGTAEEFSNQPIAEQFADLRHEMMIEAGF